MMVAFLIITWTFVWQREALLGEQSDTVVAKVYRCVHEEGRGCHHLSHLSRHVLRARRGVVRMLIVLVLTFAVCNLPFHARKMWQYWSTGYQGTSDFSALLTPLTFLVTYFNSGINPLLYAFLSKNFRKGMRELIFCKWQSKRKSENLIVLNPVGASVGVGGVLRRSSTRTTRANCSTVTMAPAGDLWELRLRRHRCAYKVETMDVSWLNDSTDEVTDSSGMYTISVISKRDMYDWMSAATSSFSVLSL